MTTLSEFIEIVDGVHRIIGTQLTVEDVVVMHVVNDVSVVGIIENHDLSYAQVYAALAYYYNHKDAIDRIVKAPLQTVEELPQHIYRHIHTTLTKYIDLALQVKDVSESWDALVRFKQDRPGELKSVISTHQRLLDFECRYPLYAEAHQSRRRRELLREVIEVLEKDESPNA